MFKVKISEAPVVRAFERFSTTGAPKALSNALNTAIRAGRSTSLKLLKAETGLKRTRDITDGAAKELFLAKPDRLEARWTPSARTHNLIEVGAKFTRGVALTASTHRLSGGGSKSLVAKHGFIIKTAKGLMAVNRTVFGAGTHRKGYKPMRTTSPRTIIVRQPDNPVAKAWAGATETAFMEIAPRQLQTYIDRAGLGPREGA